MVATGVSSGEGRKRTKEEKISKSVKKITKTSGRFIKFRPKMFFKTHSSNI
jgi:hypothetical protein